jgi:hypothetical protein
MPNRSNGHRVWTCVNDDDKCARLRVYDCVWARGRVRACACVRARVCRFVVAHPAAKVIPSETTAAIAGS